MTYGQLDMQTNQLARYLQSLGVGRDVPVAVLMERSLDLIVAVMGAFSQFTATLSIDLVGQQLLKPTGNAHLVLARTIIMSFIPSPHRG